MKKIKICLTLLFFITLLLCASKVKAAGTISLSASKSTVNVGDEFTVSVNLSGASVATLTARVTVDTSKVEYVSGPSNTSFSNGRAIYTWTDPTGGSNPKTSGTLVTFRFRAKQAGKASFSVNGDFYTPDEKPVNPSFSGTSVTIQEKTTITPPSSGGTTGGGSTGGTTGGGTSSGGNNSGGSNTGSGSTSGGSSSGGSSSNGGTSGGSTSGNTGGSNQNGTQNKPSGGSSSSGTTQNVSTNANLKELHLSVEGLSPAFNKNTIAYNIVIPNNIDAININAVPEDSNAKVSIAGNTNLQVGLNNITIKVTAPDNKTTKTYTIHATKTDNPELANANLENLAIENVMLDPEFNADIVQYSAIIGSTHDTLNILAVPQIEGATVNIQGADNIQFGDNVITISVIAKDGITTKDYVINLHKKTAEEEQQELEQINLLQEEINGDEQEENKIGVGNIVFCVIIVVGVGGIIFVLIRKYIKENR